MTSASPSQATEVREGQPEAPAVTRENWREAAGLFWFIWPYRKNYCVGLAFLFAASVLNLCFPYLTGSLIDVAINSVHRAPNWISTLTLSQLLLLLLGATVMQAILAAGEVLSFSTVGQHALADLRRKVYARLLSLPMTFFAQRRVGELTSRISGDVVQTEDALVDLLPRACYQVTTLIGGLTLMAMTSVRLTLTMVCIFPATILLTRIIGGKIRKLSGDVQDRLADSGTIVEETFQAIASVKAFANEAFELIRYQRASGSLMNTALHVARWRALYVGLMILGTSGGIGLVMWVGALLLQSGEITAGELTRFFLYMMFLSGITNQSAELFSMFQRVVGATRRVREILRETPEGDESRHSENLAGPSARSAGDVAFERVTFRYPARPDVSVISEVSLTVRSGEKVALIGPSGAGKSTLTALLMRFYEPDDGRVLIDGRDARTYPLAWLRAQVAIVPQEILLFGGSIEENIGYGRLSATAEEIREAARLANAHDFIMSFPEGYATIVGDRGMKLSGGQRQRIAIARAILKNPAILILDEATSSLDSESEALIQTALERLMHGRTTFIIAHRLATVRAADRIAVLQSGRIVELGTHAELLVRPDGLYRKLSALQGESARPAA
jgi:ABC-type multidrug transport system fused ATPase/permease subunit